MSQNTALCLNIVLSLFSVPLFPSCFSTPALGPCLKFSGPESLSIKASHFYTGAHSFLWFIFQLVHVSLQDIILQQAVGCHVPAAAPSPLTEYNSLSWSWSPSWVRLPPWRPTRDSGALKTATGPECQVLLFLISGDADEEKEAHISWSLSLRWGETYLPGTLGQALALSSVSYVNQPIYFHFPRPAR